MRSTLYKIIRITAIILMSLTVAFTLLGGIGSTCAAFLTENFAAMSSLLPYRWLYQLLVIVSVAIGLGGIRALVGLVKGKAWAYRETLLVLCLGGLTALIQVVASRLLRGASMPTDVRLYITALTLIVFLLLRLPGVWEKLNFAYQEGGHQSGMAGGLTAISLGLMVLTVHLWAKPSHTFDGTNYLSVWSLPLTAAGWALAIFGAALLAKSIPPISSTKTPVIPNPPETSGSI
jgi:hypothetical protein